MNEILFIGLAFFGLSLSLGACKLGKSGIIAGLIIKWAIALGDTPFIYLAKKIKPLDLK